MAACGYFQSTFAMAPELFRARAVARPTKVFVRAHRELHISLDDGPSL